MSNHVVLVRNAEVLSVTSGTLGGRPQVFLSMRLNPDTSFECTTLALTPQQGRRLLRDLQERFQRSLLLRDDEGELTPSDSSPNLPPIAVEATND